MTLLVGPEINLHNMHIFAAAKSKSFTPTVETKKYLSQSNSVHILRHVIH
jgi:hypothetical protein